MLSNVPLTAEKLTASNNLLADNLLILGKLYQNELEEYQLAADTYEDRLRRFPERTEDGEIYLALYFCYSKLDNKSRAEYYKALLTKNFPNSKSGKLITNPVSGDPKAKDNEATRVYDAIYNLFIEGNFEKAFTEKRKADSLYGGVNYWTPQLLYIEALYHVRQQNDSLAIGTLQAIINTYPNSPLKAKAMTMIDVLKRRKEIEAYLTSLQVTRDTEENLKAPPDNPAVIKKTVVPVAKVDSVKKENKPLTNGQFTLDLKSPQMVIMILEKVDGVYVNETKNALDRYNRENYYGQNIQIVKDVLDADRSLLLISSFADAETALLYYDKIKRGAKTEISWLPANKYSFMIIDANNLGILKANKNFSGYKTLLNTQYPNRF